MQITLKCEVTEVSKNLKYDYGYTKQTEVTTSSLKVLNNKDHIEGSIRLPGDLGFGRIYELIINTSNPIEVIRQTETQTEVEERINKL